MSLYTITYDNNIIPEKEESFPWFYLVIVALIIVAVIAAVYAVGSHRV